MIYFLVFILGFILGYWLSKDTQNDEIRFWDGICAVCHKPTAKKDMMQTGQKTNDKEASVVTMIKGHKKCLLPIARETLEQKGDLREFNR